MNSRRLGIRSALLLPLFNVEAVVTGVLGVFSERPSAFDDYDLATPAAHDGCDQASQLSASPRLRSDNELRVPQRRRTFTRP